MNMSILISRIKKDLGLYGMVLPINNVDEAIAEIVKDITLRTFSTLYPKKDTMRVKFSDLPKSETTSEYAEYFITGKNNTPIAFVEDVYPDDVSGNGWGGISGVYTNDIIYQNMLGNAAVQLGSLIIPAMTFEFISPNRLRIYNPYFVTAVVISYGQMHDSSLSSIPFTAEESFYRLAVLDVKQTFYNIVKHYNELQTAHGRIDLHIDNWQDAEQAREQLVNNWEDTYHLDQKTIYWA